MVPPSGLPGLVITTLSTPARSAAMAFSNFGIIPPDTVPSATSALNLSGVISGITDSGFSGSERTPGISKQ